MNDLEFCEIQVEQIVTLYQAPDQIVAKVNELMTKRMPVERLHRRALRDWAQAEQSKAEALIASGKTVPLETMSNANRRMAMLQTVISAIEKFDAPSDVGDAA
jgi:hypothetical protein